MICKPCAEGAAARGEVARDLLHQQCIGCPCQHRAPSTRARSTTVTIVFTPPPPGDEFLRWLKHNRRYPGAAS